MYQFETEIEIDGKMITVRHFAQSEGEVFKKLDNNFGHGEYIPGRMKRRYVGIWEQRN